MKVETHRRDKKVYIEGVKNWSIEDKEKKKVVEFLEDYLNGKITGRIGTNPNALIEKVALSLRPALEIIKQPTRNKVEKFFQDLVVNKKVKTFNKKTKKYNGKPYSHRTQIEIINTLRRYLSWRYKDINLIEPLNIKIKVKDRDIESLTMSEVEKLYRYCKTDEERYIISGLFSTGARVEEFMSLTFQDITLPEKKGEEFIKVVIKNSTSKTKGRTISLYWTETLESFPKFLEQRRNEGAKPNDFVLTRSYNSLKKWVSRLGEKVLNKRVHCHMFRHSCADWLASRLNRQQLCIYFGWSFSSNMPDVYIKRQNVDMQVVEETMKKTNYQELQDKIKKLEYENKMKNEEVKQILEVVKEIQRRSKEV